jgi:hypothetical protein
MGGDWQPFVFPQKLLGEEESVRRGVPLIHPENRPRSRTRLQINPCENCHLAQWLTRHGSPTIYRCFALPYLPYRWRHQYKMFGYHIITILLPYFGYQHKKCVMQMAGLCSKSNFKYRLILRKSNRKSFLRIRKVLRSYLNIRPPTDTEFSWFYSTRLLELGPMTSNYVTTDSAHLSLNSLFTKTPPFIVAWT